MVSKHPSTQISTRYSFASNSVEGTIGENTDMLFHNGSSNCYFYGPQFLVNFKGNALNVELDLHDYEDTQTEPNIPSRVAVHPFHGGDTQQWLIHDDGKGGAALMSKHNNKYIAPSPDRAGVLFRDVPYFWKISKKEKGYSFGMKNSESNLYFCLVNNTTKLRNDSEPIFVLPSTPENYAAIQKSQFTTSPGPITQLADDPIFPDGAPGLPSHYILDTVATGRECSGFPTGFFRIRVAGTSLYWSLHCAEASKDGNGINLWSLMKEEDAQAFYIDSKGELSLCGGHVDVCENALIYTKIRAPTTPWPNPWSHPMPTFSFSNETKCISVKFYADPCIPGRWPRADVEWKEKEFVVAAECTQNVSIPEFQKVSRWALTQRFVVWTHRQELWCAKESGTLGVEEKPQLTDTKQEYPTRFRWELEEV